MIHGDNQFPHISFDDDHFIRVLEKESIQHTIDLEQESKIFASKLDEFHTIISNVLELLESQAAKIERAKLKAIGQRNRVDYEVENRQRQKQQLELLIKEKLTELERYNLQYQSLSKVADENQILLDRLSNNEA